MSDRILKEMQALSIVMDDLREKRIAGKIRVWMQAVAGQRRVIAELRREDMVKAEAITKLQDALEPTAFADTPEEEHEAEDNVEFDLSDEEFDTLDKYFGITFERL